MRVTPANVMGLAKLMNVVVEYGEVTGVDDDTEEMTVDLGGVSYVFVVKDGNDLGVQRPLVMLTAINGHAVVVEEIAGAYEVQPHVADWAAYRFATHGTCPECGRGDHAACRRQTLDGRCRCLCSVDWAVMRARGEVKDAESQSAPLSGPERPAANVATPLPSRDSPIRPCGCECQAGLPCGGCGHAGCSAR